MNPLFPVLAIVILLLDQITKSIVIQKMPLHDSIPLLPFFSLTHVRNTGAAFGIFPGANAIFIVVMVLVLAVLTISHRKIARNDVWTTVGLGLLWGGALGNLLDRLRHGSVTDFLDFFWRTWHWPVFNVADSAICVGIFILAIRGLFEPSAKKPSTV
jgi:signal peptidase II